MFFICSQHSLILPNLNQPVLLWFCDNSLWWTNNLFMFLDPHSVNSQIPLTYFLHNNCALPCAQSHSTKWDIWQLVLANSGCSPENRLHLSHQHSTSLFVSPLTKTLVDTFACALSLSFIVTPPAVFFSSSCSFYINYLNIQAKIYK